jgi:hypothetical protein
MIDLVVNRRPAMRGIALMLLVGSVAALPARGQSRDEARPRDLQRLQEDLTNLDDEMGTLEPGDPKADGYRQRAEEIREEVIFLKVKMRHSQKTDPESTGVTYDEVVSVQRSIRDLREDIEGAFGGRGEGALRLAEGTEIQVRLDEALSSKTARREDRFDASVLRPVRAQGALAVPAGARVRGIVKDVEPARRPSKEGRLELDFDSLYLERTRVDLRSHVVSLSDNNDNKKETAGKAGVGAALGGILGAMFGGGKGAVIGGILGGGGAVVGTKGDDVELPAGTVLTLRLDKPLVVERP